MIEQGLEKEVFYSIKREFNQYVGRCFEDICREFVLDLKMFKFDKIGRWWHMDKEIDIAALNEKTKEILFAECKWQDKVNVEKILVELKEKSQHVQWYNNKRKEYYAIFAKSFKKKIKEPNLFLFDLKDLEKIIK